DEIGKWNIVSGALEGGAYPDGSRLSAEQQIEKEIKEEIGVLPHYLNFVGHRSLFQPELVIALDFFALVPVKGVHNAEPHKHDELCWATRHAIPYPGHRFLATYLAKYRERIAREIYRIPFPPIPPGLSD